MSSYRSRDGQVREARDIPNVVNVSKTYLRRETMMKLMQKFRKDEAGAVTVDWVVLTAAVVGLAIAAYSTIEDNANTLITAAGGAVAAENDF